MSEIQNSQLSTLNSPLIPPGYKQTEAGVIPEDWEVATVREIASTVKNAIVGGPFGSDLVSNDYVEEGVPVIRGQNMGGKYLAGNFAFVTLTKAISLKANLARPSDLVFTQRGTLGQVSLVPDRLFSCYLVSQSQMKLTVNRKAANPKFFYYIFISSEQQEFVRQNTIQTGVPHINLGILRNIPVQRPPIAEQQAIAEALSDADAFIESLEQLIAKKRHIKQGAMQELLTGKKRLPGFGGEWEVKRLGEIATFFSGGTPSTAVATYYDGGEIPWITSGDLNKSFVREVQGRITKEGLEKSSEKIIDINTLLIALYGATSGVIAISKIWAAINQAVLAIIPRNDNSLFLFYKLGHLKDWIINTYTQGGQPNLSGDIVKSIELALPAVEEQTAIASILSDMDAEIAALEAKLAKARQIKQGMMRELLTGRIRLVNPVKSQSTG